MKRVDQLMVTVQVMGHLIYYLPKEQRDGARACAQVPSGTALGYLPDMLSIPRHEIHGFIVNGRPVNDMATVLGPGDVVVILPVVSGG